LKQVIRELQEYLRARIGYFPLVETPRFLEELEGWIRKPLRYFVAKQWINNCHTRYKKLRRLGVNTYQAEMGCGVSEGASGVVHYETVEGSLIQSVLFSNRIRRPVESVSGIEEGYVNRRVRTRMPGGVGGRRS
jgi:hypothetical protein